MYVHKSRLNKYAYWLNKALYLTFGGLDFFRRSFVVSISESSFAKDFVVGSCHLIIHPIPKLLSKADVVCMSWILCNTLLGQYKRRYGHIWSRDLVNGWKLGDLIRNLHFREVHELSVIKPIRIKWCQHLFSKDRLNKSCRRKRRNFRDCLSHHSIISK